MSTFFGLSSAPTWSHLDMARPSHQNPLYHQQQSQLKIQPQQTALLKSLNDINNNSSNNNINLIYPDSPLCLRAKINLQRSRSPRHSPLKGLHPFLILKALATTS